LRIRRLGGIAGVTLRAELDTSKLPAEHVQQVEESVRELAGRRPGAPPLPDAFRYEITPLDEPESSSILLDERDVPADLSGLIKALTELGEIERPDR
jgi:hypothetical protein